MRTSQAGASSRSRMLVGTSKFGWCLTNQHEQCLEISSSGYCRCECHSKKEDVND
jgi:hypothetical protein